MGCEVSSRLLFSGTPSEAISDGEKGIGGMERSEKMMETDGNRGL